MKPVVMEVEQQQQHQPRKRQETIPIDDHVEAPVAAVELVQDQQPQQPSSNTLAKMQELEAIRLADEEPISPKAKPFWFPYGAIATMS